MFQPLLLPRSALAIANVALNRGGEGYATRRQLLTGLRLNEFIFFEPLCQYLHGVSGEVRGLLQEEINRR